MPLLTALSLPELLELNQVFGHDAPKLIRFSTQLKMLELEEYEYPCLIVSQALSAVARRRLEVVILNLSNRVRVKQFCAALKPGLRKFSLATAHNPPSLPLGILSTLKEVELKYCSRVDVMLNFLAAAPLLQTFGFRKCSLNTEEALVNLLVKKKIKRLEYEPNDDAYQDDQTYTVENLLAAGHLVNLLELCYIRDDDNDAQGVHQIIQWLPVVSRQLRKLVLHLPQLDESWLHSISRAGFRADCEIFLTFGNWAASTKSVVSLDALATVTSLVRLEIWSENITDLVALENLPFLQSPHFLSCSLNVQAAFQLSRCARSLELLRLDCCFHLENLTPIVDHQSSDEIDLESLKKGAIRGPDGEMNHYSHRSHTSA